MTNLLFIVAIAFGLTALLLTLVNSYHTRRRLRADPMGIRRRGDVVIAAIDKDLYRAICDVRPYGLMGPVGWDEWVTAACLVKLDEERQMGEHGEGGYPGYLAPGRED